MSRAPGAADAFTVEDAKKLARGMQSDERYHHTECVVAAAEMLAERFGADPARAALAAWLHDILKEQPKALLLQRLEGSDIIDVTQIRDIPALWHSYAGGMYVRDELCLDDEIAAAVSYHTAGRAGMSLLEKVVFLADYISEDRDFRGVEEVRDIAKTDLNAACIAALRNGIIHLCKQQRLIDLNTIRAFNDLCTKQGSR